MRLISLRHKSILAVLVALLAANAFCYNLNLPTARATSNTVTLSADTAVFLSGSGITLTLASGSTLVSYAASSTALTLSLDAGSSVTVRSNNLYTLANDQNAITQCSVSPAYSYISFTGSSPEAVTVTPSQTVACASTAPVISSFSAAPASITSGQSSTLSWSVASATTVSLDNGLGTQSGSSVSVSPTLTTTYTLSAANYLGTTTAQTTVTVTAPSGGGGGGGGGGGIPVTPPSIISFSAAPGSIQPGQSSVLSWQTSGTASIQISPAVSTAVLNPASGTATATPATTTVYTLTASNSYGQTVTATAQITVSGTAPVIPPSGPDVVPPPDQPATSQSGPAYCLVNRSGTFSLILNGIRHAIANPGLLYSWGYGFTDPVPDTAAYQSLPEGGLLTPDDGALVKSPAGPTVYLIANGLRHGFTSAKVFTGLGYKFTSVLTIPVPQLSALPDGDLISNASSRHLRGANINDKGTIYLVNADTRTPYPSLATYNTWNLKNDFSRVLPANAADLALPVGEPISPRSNCAN